MGAMAFADFEVVEHLLQARADVQARCRTPMQLNAFAESNVFNAGCRGTTIQR